IISGKLSVSVPVDKGLLEGVYRHVVAQAAIGQDAVIVSVAVKVAYCHCLCTLTEQCGAPRWAVLAMLAPIDPEIEFGFGAVKPVDEQDVLVAVFVQVGHGSLQTSVGRKFYSAVRVPVVFCEEDEEVGACIFLVLIGQNDVRIPVSGQVPLVDQAQRSVGGDISVDAGVIKRALYKVVKRVERPARWRRRCIRFLRSLLRFATNKQERKNQATEDLQQITFV